MTTRAAYVAAGRSLLSTPYHAHARLPSVGVDCVGVPIVAAWLCGLRPRSFDIQGYSMKPDGSMLPLCEQLGVRIKQDELRPGDFVVLRYGAEPHHIGLVGDYRHGGLSLIHAENYRHQKVMEHRLWFDGAMHFVAAYQVPEFA